MKKWIWTGIGAALGLLIIGVAFALGGYGDTEAQAPSNEEIQQVRVNLTKDQIAGHLIADVHDRMNTLVGWGRYNDFVDTKSKAWNEWEGVAQTVKSELQQAKAEVKKHGGQPADLVAKDLDNAIALVDVATNAHNADALLYLHRIVSDLGQFAYGYYTDHHAFGYTNLFHGSNVAKVEQLIKSGN